MQRSESSTAHHLQRSPLLKLLNVLPLGMTATPEIDEQEWKAERWRIKERLRNIRDMQRRCLAKGAPPERLRVLKRRRLTAESLRRRHEIKGWLAGINPSCKREYRWDYEFKASCELLPIPGGEVYLQLLSAAAA